ncbi:MAG TPA: AsmA family protein [Telluria sp.]|nr:AsmA family protein [Telluria sp.]
MESPPATRKPLSRPVKIALWVAGILIAIPLVAAIFLLTYDWNRARPWLNAKVSEAIERPFAINGNLSVQWEQPSARMRPGERTWRDFIPWPHLRANDVHVGNPANMDQRDMASVRQFDFSLNPFALLAKEIEIPLLRFDTPQVTLERVKDGRANWVFKKQDEPSKWALDIQRVVFSDGTVLYKDALTRADIRADVRSLEGDDKYGVGWKMKGTFRNAPVSGSGKAGAVLSLRQQTTPFPIQGRLEMNRIALRAEGTLTKPTRLAAIDMRLHASGASMARLYELTGVLFPETPAFTTEGHLLGELSSDSKRWTYENFKGKVGSSDIRGKLEYKTGKPRGMLTANVVSERLDFKDLGPLIGADSNESKRKRGVDDVQPTNKLLPVERFKTERWTSVDADVRFAAARIIREKELPISKLSTHLYMKNGVLSLVPLNFKMAGGDLTSTIRLDGSGRAGKNAIKAEAKVAARRLKLNQLFPAIEQMKASIGEVNGDAKLTATGDSVASLMAASNGELKAVVSQGTVSKLLLEQMGLNIGSIVLTKLFGDKTVQINCLATDFNVNRGVAQTQVFVVDTEEALVNVGGAVNLNTEQIDLTVLPRTKGLRIISLRAPIYVRGTFRQPDVSIDKGVLALKAGSALALGAVAPLAALLPLISAGPDKDSPCRALLAQASEKPVAPPPGKPSGVRR